MTDFQWIAVDWGTTRLRAWGMSGDTVTFQRQADTGMGGLTRDGFESALLDLIGDLLPDGRRTRVVACGMVGARQGWVEAGYRAVPCAPLADDFVRAPTTDPRLSVHVVGGLSQMDPGDVMRGEETQIAGFQAMNPKFDGVLCLPGSHSKWVHVSAGEVISFQTFMTGELFAALSNHTVLRHTIGGDDWDNDAFAAGVTDALSRPEKIAAMLFSLRADSVLKDQTAATGRARLSGLLLGAELAGAKPYWLGQSVAIVGATEISTRYAEALLLQGVSATVADGSAMTLKGLCAAHAAMKDFAI
jgi:2-dehydro-3-deoxygalactonokinase